MGNVAPLFPYRDSNGRLGFRGKVGCKKADGVTEGVSKFFPVRVGGRLMLRGKGPDGKILWGYPYRNIGGRLMGRTIQSGFTTPCGCTACHIVVTLSGFPDGFGSGACSNTDFTGLNGTHTLTLSSDGCNYCKVPADRYWLPYSGCTIAQAFPAQGTQMGPHIYVGTWYIQISGKGNGYLTCEAVIPTGIFNCGEFADLIGHTWYVPLSDFNGAVRLDALL